MAARRPGSRTTTKTQGWRFSALGAWRRRLQDPFDDVVGHLIGSEGPAGALAQDDVEEVGHGCGS